MTQLPMPQTPPPPHAPLRLRVTYGSKGKTMNGNELPRYPGDVFELPTTATIGNLFYQLYLRYHLSFLHTNIFFPPHISRKSRLFSHPTTETLQTLAMSGPWQAQLIDLSFVSLAKMILSLQKLSLSRDITIRCIFLLLFYFLYSLLIVF